MANTPDVKTCSSASVDGGPQSPFHSIRYHFGMLLGVSDFETEQSYHRGKTWLHNQWLHRQGVAWGYGVELDTESGEIRVRRGLALDAIGRELHLEQDACLSVAAWFAAHHDDAGFEFKDKNGDITFDAHVVVRFKTCLTRQVPAMTEPCENSAGGTAYSRIFETVEIFLRPGLAPETTTPYHRLRLLFGLDEPLEEDGAVTASDQEVLDAHATLASFRRFAALDEIDLEPPADADEYPVVLANITGITLTGPEDDRQLTGGTVDIAVRPSHVATAAIQELLCGRIGASAGPGIEPGSVVIDEPEETVTFTSSASLAAASVSEAAFSLSTFDEAAGWTEVNLTGAAYDDTTRAVTVEFDGPLGGQLVRFMARGSGPTPLLGAGFEPFHDGQDFVHSQERS